MNSRLNIDGIEMLTKLWFSALKEALKLTAQAQNALDYTMKHAHTEWPSSPVRGAYLRVGGEGMEVHKESAEKVTCNRGV